MAPRLRPGQSRKVDPEEAIDTMAQRDRSDSIKRFPGEIRYEKKSDKDANIESKIDTNAMNAYYDAQIRDEYDDKRKRKR